MWLVLFAGAPVSAVLILTTRPRGPSGGHQLANWSRAVLAVVAVAMAALAVTIWVDGWRDSLNRSSPVDLAGLTGTYLGAWCSFTAALTGWAAVRGRWDDARLPIVALGAVGAGLAIAFLTTFDDLRRPGAALAAAIALILVAVLLYAAERPDRRGPTPAARREHPQHVAGADSERALVGQALGPRLVAAGQQPVLAHRARLAAGQAPRLRHPALGDQRHGARPRAPPGRARCPRRPAPRPRRRSPAAAGSAAPASGTPARAPRSACSCVLVIAGVDAAHAVRRSGRPPCPPATVS